MQQDQKCIFCKIASGAVRSRIIKQNERAIVLLDAFPLAAGHSLIIPKSHYAKLQEMSKQDSQAVFELLQEVTGAIEKVSGVDASTIAIHNGKDAGQEIPHVHVHIIPRKAGDGAGPVHSMFGSRPELKDSEMDLLLRRIKQFIP
jgi:histidine triad (HIT) family protein